MRYVVPIVSNGRFKGPAYPELFAGASLERVAMTADTITVSVHSGPPLFEPMLAPGHAELATKPDVVVVDEAG